MGAQKLYMDFSTARGCSVSLTPYCSRVSYTSDLCVGVKADGGGGQEGLQVHLSISAFCTIKKNSQTREQLLVCFPFCLQSSEAEVVFPEYIASISSSVLPLLLVSSCMSSVSSYCPASARVIPLRLLPPKW